MNEFLKFFDDKVNTFPMHLEIGYYKISDWTIRVYKKGCAEDYKQSERYGSDAIIVNVQSNDVEYVFAAAQLDLKMWLLDNCDGY